MKLRALIAAMLLVAGIACRERAGQPETDTTGTAQAESQTGTGSVNSTAPGGTVANVTPEDKERVVNAGMAGLAEVQMSNLALQNASNSDVKSFAQRMVTDHSKSNAELAQLATTKGLALPTELDNEHKGALDHLTSLSGAEFDKAYMKHMVEDHQKAVAHFQTGSTSASDPDIKTWAGKTLPTLQEHAQLAQSVAGKV